MHADASTDWGEVTRLLHEVRDGGRAALDRVLPLIYDDLRALARRQLRREYQARTLEPTSLVHEAYIKMAGGAVVAPIDRAHFLALAAHAMRQVLVDHARRRTTAKRGDGWQRTTLGDESSAVALDALEMLALNDALARLDQRRRQIVECRFFGGMEEKEIATALGISERTVRREWVKARAWLNRLLYAPNHGHAVPATGG